MAMVENDRPRGIQWNVIKVIRRPMVDGKSSAIQIRQGITDSGNLTFSYVFGLFIQDDNRSSGERWVTYHYIPDRFAHEYLSLFDEAICRVRGAMRDAEATDGSVTPKSLQAAVTRGIKRRRSKS
jgi:hypothetical protein